LQSTEPERSEQGKILKKFILGMTLSLFMLGAAQADAVPKYNASCMFNGCGGVSQEGQRAIFTFDDMYPGPDEDFDIYERVGGQTRPLIDYPDGKKGHALLQFVSDDARRAIVETRSPLTADDTDGNGEDFFAYQDGVPELISWDPADPSTRAGDIDLQLINATDDGKTLYFFRFNKATPLCHELWKRTPTSFSRVTNDCDLLWMRGLSRDGSSVFYDDYSNGLWRVKDDARVPVNDQPHPVNVHCTKYNYFGDATEDGEAWLFSSSYRLADADTDDLFDIYLRHRDGSYELITDTADGAEPEDCTSQNWLTRAIGLSPDMTRALFVTEFPISPDDHDQSLDVYLHTPQGNELVSTSPTDQSPEIRNPTSVHLQGGRPDSEFRVDGSDDLSVIAFDSEQQLVPEDNDSDVDVYARIGDETRLVSTGPNPDRNSRKAKLLGVSNDGTTISFSTPEPLLPVDTDGRMDIYAYSTSGLSRLGDAAASASRKKRRVVLVSAESDAPRMKVLGKPSVSGRRALVRLRCPKSEMTGPCRGTVRIRFGGSGARGAARFRVKPGRSVRVGVKLNRRVAAGKGRAQVRIKAWDRLGNTYRAVRKLSFR